MRFEDWEPVYESVLKDMGYDRESDEASARLLKNLTLNSDLITEDELEEAIGTEVSIFGPADCLASDIRKREPTGALISAGSATKKVMDLGIIPNIVVTDLDGDVQSQIDASKKGAITVIHAHGDNSEAIMRYAKEFTGRIVITTQSKPDYVLCNFGGFTDGDRAACMAEHFHAKINFYGFDFENPSMDGEDHPDIKRKKLIWAKKIIGMLRI